METKQMLYSMATTNISCKYSHREPTLEVQGG